MDKNSSALTRFETIALICYLFFMVIVVIFAFSQAYPLSEMPEYLKESIPPTVAALAAFLLAAWHQNIIRKREINKKEIDKINIINAILFKKYIELSQQYNRVLVYTEEHVIAEFEKAKDITIFETTFKPPESNDANLALSTEVLAQSSLYGVQNLLLEIDDRLDDIKEQIELWNQHSANKWNSRYENDTRGCSNGVSYEFFQKTSETVTKLFTQARKLQSLFSETYLLMETHAPIPEKYRELISSQKTDHKWNEKQGICINNLYIIFKNQY